MDNERLLAEIEELNRRLSELARENAVLRYERDVAWEKLTSLLPKATPEEEAEFLRQLESEEFVDGEEFIRQIIGELEMEDRHIRERT